jgi:tetratricopeptide (TPR) repeat protein
MRRTILAAFMLAATATSGVCASYDDLNAALSYFEQEQYDNAITWFSKALAAGDLIPDLTRIAYLDRGMAYLAKGDTSHAISDFTSAITANPDNVLAYRERIAVYLANGEFEKAVADYDKLRSLRPFDYDIAMNDGLLNWQLNRIETSASAFLAFSEVSPYSWSWLQLSNIRLGKPMTGYKETYDNRKWPGQIPRFFLGHASESEVLNAAEDTGNNGSICAAKLLAGMWRIVHNDQEGAAPLLKAAGEKCTKDSSYGHVIHSELVKIGSGEKVQ